MSSARQPERERAVSQELSSGVQEELFPEVLLPENKTITSFPPLDLSKRRLPECGGRFTYSLGGLMLLVTLISLHLALIVGVPCLGVPVAVLAVPSYAWSSLILAKKRRNGRQVGLLDAIGSFVECFAWVVAILISVVTVPWLLAALPAILVMRHFYQQRRRRAASLPTGSADDNRSSL